MNRLLSARGLVDFIDPTARLKPIAFAFVRVAALAASLVTAPLSAQAQKSTDTASTKAARQKDRSSPTPGIQDNSFLIEEAYNQEHGVVQHISVFVHDQRSASFAYQFTQEWPVGGISNQLSYSVALLRADASSGAGVGDTRVNYRYQLVGDGSARVAVAPRLTSILPTGDYKRGRGAGALGVEAWFPVSVVLTGQLVAHGNIGLTLTPHARDTEGARATTYTWTSGGSLVWLARSSFNVLLETIYQRVEDVANQDRVVRRSSTVVSPGVRWAYNFPSGLQIVPGVAVPLGVGRTAGERSVLVYLSFEHPFTRTAREPSKKPTFILLLTSVALAVLAGIANASEALVVAPTAALLIVLYGVSALQAVFWRNRVQDWTVQALFLVLPMAAATALVLAHIVTGRFRLGVLALAALATLCVATWNSVLNLARTRQTPQLIALRKRLAAARAYFRQELAKSKPALRDDWFPYLMAFGLGPQMDKWFHAFSGASTGISQTSMSYSSGGSSSGSGNSWTGFGGGGGFSGGGSSGAWAAAVGTMAAGVSAPSSSSSGGGSSGGGIPDHPGILHHDWWPLRE